MYLKKLMNLRSEHKLSQAELSEILGVTPQAISAWETGKAKPAAEYVKKAAEYFNVSFDYLFNDDPEDPNLKINQALNESGLSTPDETFTMEEIERSIDIIRAYREKEKELEAKIRKELEGENNDK